MAQRATYLTHEGLAKLQAELDYLHNVRRQEVAERIQRAKEIGGTVDNAEYDESKNEQAFVEGRILELENMIQRAVIIPGRKERQDKSDKVDIGSSVTVLTSQGKKEQYVIVGSTEADPLSGKISNESPVGRALLGHKVNDEVDIKTPAGVIRLTILKIK